MVQILNKRGSDPSWGDILGTGLGAGINRLAEIKMQDIKRQKAIDSYRRAGYHPQHAEFLAELESKEPAAQKSIGENLKTIGMGYQNPPQNAQDQMLGTPQPNQAPQPNALPEQQEPESFAQVFARGVQKQNATAKTNDPKLEQEWDSLETLSGDVDTMLDMAQGDDVDFSAKSHYLSLLPEGVGNRFLNESTGFYNNLSNKVVVDTGQNLKGIRSLGHLKLIAKTKMGLDKTKAQNIAALKHLKKEIDHKKNQFSKRHPDIAQLENNPIHHEFSNSSNLISENKIVVQNINGKMMAINPSTGKLQEVAIEG